MYDVAQLQHLHHVFPCMQLPSHHDAASKASARTNGPNSLHPFSPAQANGKYQATPWESSPVPAPVRTSVVPPANSVATGVPAGHLSRAASGRVELASRPSSANTRSSSTGGYGPAAAAALAAAGAGAVGVSSASAYYHPSRDIDTPPQGSVDSAAPLVAPAGNWRTNVRSTNQLPTTPGSTSSMRPSDKGQQAAERAKFWAQFQETWQQVRENKREKEEEPGTPSSGTNWTDTDVVSKKYAGR